MTGSYETAKTVFHALEEIRRGKYFLPAIQREFVWSPEKIEKLFDSLLSDYPIGSFLFWRVEEDQIKQFQFYKFIENYVQANPHNPVASLAGTEEIHAILDGQQRLTALYLGLRGSYTSRGRYQRQPTTKFLYLDLLFSPDLQETEEDPMKYKFKFILAETAKTQTTPDKKVWWYEVKKVLEQENSYALERSLKENMQEKQFTEEDIDKAQERLRRLHQSIRISPTISYYEVTNQDLDVALQIFTRANSGGVLLSLGDLLLSTATALWKQTDARKEIHDFVDEMNKQGDGFDFDTNFVLKACLVLSDIGNITYKVKNFNRQNMGHIEEKWEDIKDALERGIDFAVKHRYNHKTLTANNSIIPIAYYLMLKKPNGSYWKTQEGRQDEENILNWLRISLIRHFFGTSSDTRISKLRTIIRENYSTGFPYEKIKKEYSQVMSFSVEDVPELLDRKYQDRICFSILTFLYPNLRLKNDWAIDHIFPRSFFKPQKLQDQGISPEDIQFFMDQKDKLVNLQILDSGDNRDKSDRIPQEWLSSEFNEEQQKRYRAENYIPDNLPLTFANFKAFVEQREKLLKDALCNCLIKG